MSGERSRRLAAIMFTDVVGYTSMMQDDEEAARVVRQRHRETLEAAIKAHGGELIQYLGDGSLTTFPSTVHAVSAALVVQRALRDEVPLRIGIHQGEIAFDEQGIYGDSVNIAARVMGLGTPGSVLISDKAQAELANQRSLSAVSLGQFHLKNVRRPPIVYAVEGEGVATPLRDDLLAESTALYTGIVQRWPQIAGGVLITAVLLGRFVGEVSSGISFQSYVFAWAAATAGLWFLFDKAETTMSYQARRALAEWLRGSNLRQVIGSFPSQFLVLFDRIFGERHLTWRCFTRSAVASLFTVWVVSLVWAVRHPPPSILAGGLLLFGLTIFGVVFNLVPDYLSLLETRYLLGRIQRGAPMWVLLFADVAATAAIGLAGYLLGYLVTGGRFDHLSALVRQTIIAEDILVFELGDGIVYSMPLGLFFYSTFFTSVWLWLYAASIFLTRILLRMNSGVGVLLRVTDVERQPFRSLGFVGVIIVSGLFALGLPLVLW